MKTIISAVVVAGALIQMSNAMGPMGDNTHRRFYKNQEWIWQKVPPGGESAPNGKAAIGKPGPIHFWTPVASSLPVRPPLASSLPVRPPLASSLPVRPPLASSLPVRPPLASSLPVRPPLASTLPVRPPLVSALSPGAPGA
jgi:hypothetical protein